MLMSFSNSTCPSDSFFEECFFPNCTQNDAITYNIQENIQDNINLLVPNDNRFLHCDNRFLHCGNRFLYCI